MTGFGASSAEAGGLEGSATVRSLNHRFLDVTVHAGRELLPLEPEIKRLVQSRVHRGRIEVSVQVRCLEALGGEVMVSRPLVAGLVRALRDIRSEHGLAGDVALADVARFPGALEVRDASGLAADQSAEILALVGRALGGLDQMRRAEGANLTADLTAGLTGIEAATDRIQAVAETGEAERQRALVEKARGLRDELGLEEGRLYQEVVRLVDKADIAEELQRLRSHARQARALLAEDGPCGKRLDFLAQELMREANTIGSKSISAAVTQEIVKLKGDIESLREQVQNVE
jgi:uncharacterized protein (TIGR00255 family)